MAELKKLMIETSVDRLVDLVRRKKAVILNDAAKDMGVSVDQIEEWVRILEDHGYVKLIYPPIGEPKIVIADLPDEFFVEKTAEFEKRKAILENRAQRFETIMAGMERGVTVDDARFRKVESELRKKLEEAEKRLRNIQRLESLKRSIKSETAELDTAAKKAVEEFDNVQTLVKELDKRVNDSLERMDKYGRDVKMIGRERGVIESEIRALDKEIKLVERLGQRRFQIPSVASIIEKFQKQKTRLEKAHKTKKRIMKRASIVKKAKTKIGKLLGSKHLKRARSRAKARKR